MIMVNIQGLVSLVDILQQIVGRFVFESGIATKVKLQADGSYLVAGSVSIKELNLLLGLELPTTGPKTVNGLLVEYLEAIPRRLIGVRISGYPIEVLEVEGNVIKRVRITPALRRKC